MALADNVEGLGHGNAGYDHGGQLAGKNGDVFRPDLLLELEQRLASFLDLDRIYALAA